MPGLSPLAIEFTGTNGQAVDFPYILRLSNLTARSISLWVKMTASSETAALVCWGANGILYESNRGIAYAQQQTGAAGIWGTSANTIPLAEWVHIVLTRDITADEAAVPVIYVNAESKSVTTFFTPSGAITLEREITIGNCPAIGYDNEIPFNGRLFDVRLYNAILTQADATALYNGGIPSMDTRILKDWNPKTRSTNLAFQPFAVMTYELADFVDQSLTGLKVFDAQCKAVGTIDGAPVGRAAPTFVTGGAVLKTDGGGILLMSGGRLMLNGRVYP